MDILFALLLLTKGCCMAEMADTFKTECAMPFAVSLLRNIIRKGGVYRSKKEISESYQTKTYYIDR